MLFTLLFHFISLDNKKLNFDSHVFFSYLRIFCMLILSILFIFFSIRFLRLFLLFIFVRPQLQRIELNDTPLFMEIISIIPFYPDS